MSSYFTEADKARVAYLLGRACALAEALALGDGGELAELLAGDLAELRQLLLPAVAATD